MLPFLCFNIELGVSSSDDLDLGQVHSTNMVLRKTSNNHYILWNVLALLPITEVTYLQRIPPWGPSTLRNPKGKEIKTSK